MRVRNVNPSGALDEESFLDRFVDLDDLPSTDARFDSARYDLRQHRFSNYDWDDDWIYSYPPLDLLNGRSETFARFLTELLHPIVRADGDEARELAREINDILSVDELALIETGSIGNRPIFQVGHPPPTTTTPPRPRRARVADLEPPVDDHRLWVRGMLRLFLSHLSAHKVAMAHLKMSLLAYGVDAFVAHEDIEPTLEWQGEIEEALRSTHALTAILTDDFHSSYWTDHEVGVALGLERLVVPVRAPTVPYGFMGRLQALRGDLADTAAIASRLVDVFLSRPETAELMRASLALALERSMSYATSKQIVAKLERISGVRDEVLADRLEAGIGTNAQVDEAFGVPDRLRAVASRLRDLP